MLKKYLIHNAAECDRGIRITKIYYKIVLHAFFFHEIGALNLCTSNYLF